MTACYGLVNELVYDLKGVSVAHLQHRDIRLPTRCRLPLVYLVSLETPFCSYPLPISSVQFRLRKLRWTFDVIEFFSFNKEKKNDLPVYYHRVRWCFVSVPATLLVAATTATENNKKSVDSSESGSCVATRWNNISLNI
jgi:hypothetical protein